MRLIGMLVVVMFAGVCGAAQREMVNASLVADTKTIQAGVPFRVGVRLKITPGWHVYWTNPGDTGIATEVNLHLPQGFTASPVMFPTPHRFATSGVISFGYEDEVVLMTTVTPPQKLEPGPVQIAADVSWLACKEVCIPGKARVDLSLPAEQTGRVNEQELFEKWSAQLPRPIDQVLEIERYSVETSAGQISVVVHWKSALPAQVQWFSPPTNALLFDDARIEVSGSATTITSRFERLKGQNLESTALDSIVGYMSEKGWVGAILPLNALQLVGG